MGFVAPATSVRTQSRLDTPVMAMGSDQMSSRRAMLASLVLAVPAAANAMVPGLNGPGLVPAKKVPKSTSTGFGRDFEAIRDRSNFWSSQGIMDSVPKMKGIITPKPGGYKTKGGRRAHPCLVRAALA